MAAEDVGESPALFANQDLKMIDKVAKIFELFDQDRDGYLSFDELNALQIATSGNILPRQAWGAVITAFSCTAQGPTVDHLRLTYKTQQADLNSDYQKCFPNQNK